MVTFRSHYNRNETAEPGVFGISDVGEVMTKQEFREECDINHIMKRYQQFGTLPSVSNGSAMYGDFSGVGDLLSSQAIVDNAREMFAALPSAVRDRFRNDPVALIAFVSDEKNRDEAVKLGLVPAPKEPENLEVPPKGDPVIPKKKVAITKK